MLPVPYHGCTCHLRYNSSQQLLASSKKHNGKTSRQNEEEGNKVNDIRHQPWYFHILASFILVVHGFTFLMPTDTDLEDSGDIVTAIAWWLGYEWDFVKFVSPYAKGLACVFNIALGIVSWWTPKGSLRYEKLIQLRVIAFCVNIIHAYVTGPLMYHTEDITFPPGLFSGRILGLFRLSYLTPGLMAAGVSEVLSDRELEETNKKDNKKENVKKDKHAK